MAGKYHIIIDGHRRGPFSKEELETQGLGRETLVWFKGQPDWIAAGRVRELLDIFDEPPPVPGEAPPLAPLPGNLTIPERAALPLEHVKDPAVNVPHSAPAPPAFHDDPDRMPLPRPPWRRTCPG